MTLLFLMIIHQLEKENLQEELTAVYGTINKYTWFTVKLVRKFLLDDSDWVFVEDSPVSTEKKELWKKYRKKLRDIPQEQKDSHPYEILFPISPDIYKKRGYKTPYLSREMDDETRQYQYYQLTNNNLENYTQKVMNYIALSVSTFPLEDKDINVVSAPENTLEEMIRFIEENHMSSDWEEPQAINEDN